ncbi:MAG: hypothetical protein MJ052_04220 [Sphaerochaetaceae bacterium]|nr:hypothetical protein [Sphaerochaetaceae bacterium]
MIDRQQWKNFVQGRLEILASKAGFSEKLPEVMIQVPPKPEMGDLAFPMFLFAKAMKKSPNTISQELSDDINSLDNKPSGTAFAAGPYMNVRLDMNDMIGGLFKKIEAEGDDYGKTQSVS